MRATLRISVAVRHREPLLSLGIEAALRDQPDIQVQSGEPMHTRPLVVIADYQGAMSWFEASADRPRLAPADRWLIVASHGRGWEVRQAVHAGALGYVLQDSAADELPEAVRSLAHGVPYLSALAARNAALSLSHGSLTRREMDVLAHLAGGAPNKAIAMTLGISIGTVKSHVQNVLAKLGAATRTEAASQARRLGLVGEAAADVRSSAGSGRSASRRPAHAGIVTMQ